MQCLALILHEGLFYAQLLKKGKFLGIPISCKLLPYTLKFSMETASDMEFLNGIFS
jgi:hypothetical protein